MILFNCLYPKYVSAPHFVRVLDYVASFSVAVLLVDKIFFLFLSLLCLIPNTHPSVLICARLACRHIQSTVLFLLSA